MEHTKKMILVTPEVFGRLNQTSEVEPDTLSLLDKEMKEVLGNNKISDYEKWTLYSQVLQRYLNIINNIRKPVPLPIIEDEKGVKEGVEKINVTDVIHEDHSEEILGSVPKTFRSKASLLLQRLKRDGNIKWDNQGVVYINQKKIINSSITDLLNDIIRPRKTGDPTGWQEFARALREMNTPFELIGNMKRQHYIKELLQYTSDNSFGDDLVNTSYESAAESTTPVVKPKPRKTEWLAFR